MADLTSLAPPGDLDEQGRLVVFQYMSHRLNAHRNTAQSYYGAGSATDAPDDQTQDELDKWVQALYDNIWVACQEPGRGNRPHLSPLEDTSTANLLPLPAEGQITKVVNTTLFLHITTTKQYHAHTRAFLFSLGIPFDEDTIAATLKHPDDALEEARRKTESARAAQAASGKAFRMAGIGLGAVAGGILVGISGGLAAPLVGAGMSAVLGWLGVGGTAAGLLASGLASSSVVCGALFGAYGSKRSGEMVHRLTREVRDLAIVPVRAPRESLAVRLCVSGWLSTKNDITSPWTVFGEDDTFALQWEVEALTQLANALNALIKSQVFKYVRGEIIKRTVLASLMAALSPTAWLQIGQIIDNPWMSARSLAIKAGKVLGILLAQRVLGSRPITLVGYSLGPLVVFEALQYLATLPPAESQPLIQDVYLFGSPIPLNAQAWVSARRVVAGRFVNGYGKDDYILAILSRVSGGSWGVAGLAEVPVTGVDNVMCEGVGGHLMWSGMVGKCLQLCNAPGIVQGLGRPDDDTKSTEIDELILDKM